MYSERPNRQDRRAWLRRLGALAGASLLGSACTGEGTLSTEPDRAAQRSRIETDWLAALARCYAADPATRAMVDAAAAVLAFPTVSASEPLADTQAGHGALRIGHTFSGYYSMTALWQGRHHAEGTRAFIFLFAHLESLAPLRTAMSTRLRETGIALPRLGPGGRIEPGEAAPPLLLLMLDGARLAVRPVPAAYIIERLDL